MSVTLPPSQFRPVTSSQGTSSAESQGVQEAALLQEAPEAPASGGTLPESYTDGFEQVAALAQEFAAKFGALSPVNAASLEVPDLAPASISGGAEASAAPVDWMEDSKDGSKPVIQQTKDTDCGAAAATILAESTGAPSAPSKEQVMNELDSRFASSQGTTPRQLTDMLAHEGLSVTKGSSIVDPHALDDALSKGQKVVAMVDSNKILPGGSAQEPGKAHWVVLDGKDEQGNYSVKDPGTGSKYSVGLDKLTDAVNSGWSTHNGGGMLVVEKAQQGENEGVTAERNAQSGLMLGNTPGVGSNARNTYGRESS